MTGVYLMIRLLALILFGLMAGFFYAFSVTVMRGLDIVDPASAVIAMNGINGAVRNPAFFLTFFVTPIIAVFAAILAFARGENLSGWIIGAAAGLYVAGVIAPTAIVNVPMNEALALFIPEKNAEPTGTVWSDYSLRWTRWNTFRGIVSTVCLVLAALSLVPKTRHQNA